MYKFKWHSIFNIIENKIYITKPYLFFARWNIDYYWVLQIGWLEIRKLRTNK